MAVTWKKLAKQDDVIAKALLTTEGDIIKRSATVPERLGVGSEDDVLTIVSGVPAWAAAAAGAPTKEFFVPATAGFPPSYLANSWGDFAVAKMDAASEETHISFFVPSDFSSITEAVIVAFWTASYTDTDLDIYSDYVAIGEVFNTHSESDEASTYTFVQYILRELDISGLLSSLAANDYVGIMLKLATDPGGFLCILGIRFKYS